MNLPGVLWIPRASHADDRGTFEVVWTREALMAEGISAEFVQDNLITTRRGTLRGMHFQARQPQGKLLSVLAGEIFEAAVDLRPTSPTFGQGAGRKVRAADQVSLWLPPGFAHGFLALSEQVHFLYKVTAPWDPEEAHVLAWDDPTVNLPWPLEEGQEPVLSARDLAGRSLAEVHLLLC